MKAWSRNILTKVLILITVGLCAFANNLRAQALDQPTQPDSIVQVTAEAEGLTPVDPFALPGFASCWWTVYPGTGPLPLPCPPQDLSVPIYEIASGIYLVDSTGGAVSLNTNQTAMTTASVAAAVERQGNAIADLIEQVQETEFEQTMAMSFGMDVPTPGEGGGEGGGTNSYGASFSLPDYGTNLWIAHVTLTNGALATIASNTLPLVLYEVQTNASLLTTNWGTLTAFPFFYGSENTNWTPLDALPVVTTQAHVFFRLKSWADDGSGLPIWWQLEHFGTTGIDPYGDPDSDGWNNLQEFQNGTSPNGFNTPPAPQGLTAILHQASSTATVNWLPSPGPVTNYLITKTSYWTGQATNFNVSPNDQSFLDNLADNLPNDLNYVGPAKRVRYSATAQYAGGNSAASSVDLGLSETSISVKAAADGQGEINLMITGLPSDLTGIKVFRAYYDVWYFGLGVLGNDIWQTSLNYTTNFSYVFDPLTNGYFEVSAASITNGVFTVPDNQASRFGAYHYWVQGERADGTTTGWSADYASDWTAYREPFLDARQLLKDNLRFVLRAASMTDGFRFGLHSIYGYYSDVARWPTNYAYASCYGTDYSGRSYRDIARPLVDNYEFQNFVYDTNHIGDAGYLTTGIEEGGYITDNPTTFFDINTLLDTSSPTVPSSLLSSQLSQWISPVNIYSDVYPTSANQHNLYGLPYLSVNSVQFTNGMVYSTVYSPVAAVTNGFPYYETAQPVFQTVAYDFWIPNNGYYDENSDWHYLDFLPEQDGFSPTNASNDHIMVPVGSSVQVASYAKLALQNGYSGVYGYLGQYFDKAYKVDGNGNVTTNTTGLLSPYGNFFATEPGEVALVTMPDIDTGERGTCVVHCVSLQLDKNHDGNMDLSFNGDDATSQVNPMTFWVNNDNDNAGVGKDVNASKLVDYAYAQIRSQRGLEDFARLWICGMPTFPTNQGYTVQIGWNNIVSGSPKIRLYLASETAGGIGYLTDTNIASQQLAENDFPFTDEISVDHPVTLPAGIFGTIDPLHFIFEAGGAGEGELTLTISKTGNPITQASVWLDLHDVNNFYERAVVTNIFASAVSNWSSAIETVQYANSSALGNDQDFIVMVHGINVDNWHWLNASETVYKRLYWAGYHGKFASVKWPCLTSLQTADFNSSELRAYKASVAVKTYLDTLRSRFPDYRLHLLAHSQGNAVVSEAIRQGASFDTYILTQGAIPASAYDINAPFYPAFTNVDATIHTPEWQPMGYEGIYTNFTGRIVNYYNLNDPVLDVWIANQLTLKPNEYILNGGNYFYDGTNSWHLREGAPPLLVTDPQESRAMVSRSRTLPIGQSGPASGHGVIQSAVDLKAQFGFDKAFPDDHSSQWTWPIQTARPYYLQIIDSISP